MSKRNRVDPYGAIHAVAARGTMMGNRGGRFHRDDGTLLARHWASRRWICCVLSFKDRRRAVMGPGYTELFFADEPTALAAGHRPCFECRRAEAKAFAAAWARAFGLDRPPSAEEMDAALHRDRLADPTRPPRRASVDTLPDGTMVAIARRPHLVAGGVVAPWSFYGYGQPVEAPLGMVDVITPVSIVATLAAGYHPRP